MTATKVEGGPIGHPYLCDVLPTENAEQISQTALGTTEGFLVTDEPVATRKESSEAYRKYITIDKGLVHFRRGKNQLLQAHDTLRGSKRPVHQSAAGWAAIELAMMATDMEQDRRMELVEKGVSCWHTAVRLYDDQYEAGVADLVNYSNAGRTELNVAMAPLLSGIVSGELTESIKREVFLDCIRVAKKNHEIGEEAGQAGHIGVKWDFNGFSLENLVMLSINQEFDDSHLALVSSLRDGNGWIDPTKTHDLIFAQPEGTTLAHATPVEVKSVIQSKHLKRYRALLIGRKHLDLSQPMGYMFDALEAVGQGTADSEQLAVTKLLHERVSVLHDQYQKAKRTSSQNAVTVFHRPLAKAA